MSARLEHLTRILGEIRNAKTPQERANLAKMFVEARQGRLALEGMNVPSQVQYPPRYPVSAQGAGPQAVGIPPVPTALAQTQPASPMPAPPRPVPKPGLQGPPPPGAMTGPPGLRGGASLSNASLPNPRAYDEMVKASVSTPAPRPDDFWHRLAGLLDFGQPSGGSVIYPGQNDPHPFIRNRAMRGLL